MKRKFFILNLIFAFLLFCCFSVNPEIVSADESGLSAKNMTNNVILIKFKDNSTFPSADYLTKLNKMYNDSDVSMRNYFLQSSMNKLCVNTEIISGNGAIVLEHTFEYYAPRYGEFDSATNSYPEINPLGYDNRYFLNGSPVSPKTAGAVEHIERIVREQELLRDVLYKTDAKLKDSDSDADGEIDSMTLILDLDEKDYESIEWNNALWPHMSVAYNLTEQLVNANNFVPSGYYDAHIKKMANDVYLDGLKVGSYNFFTTLYIEKYQLEGEYKGLSNIGVLCHEFYHTIGLYDYYSYVDSSYQSVGETDILGVTQPLPQISLCYNRQKLGWLTESVNILPIESSGSYSLNAVTNDDEVKAYKLVLNDYAQTGEYFMIEMRSNTGGGFDSMLSESGIIVYRVNEKNGFLDEKGEYSSVCYGNMYSSKGNEEIFVYRHGGGDSLNVNGGKSLAILNGSQTVDGHTYVKDRLGSTDKTLNSTIFKYNPSGVFGSFFSYYNTTIYYGNKTNSGIALSNITLNASGDAVTFDIEFDDASAPVSLEDGFALNKTLDGKTEVSWDSPARSGIVKILAVGYDDELIGENNGSLYAKYLPTIEEIENGQMSGYKTVISQNTPVSFKKTAFKANENCAVFASITDGENTFVKFVGVVKVDNSPNDVLDKIFNHEYFKIGAIIVVSVIVFVIAFSVLASVTRKMKNG